MGTRADFYIRNNNKMNWLGSIGYDGYPQGISKKLFKVQDAATFKKELANFFNKDRDDVTIPSEGWPWPWIDSNTTDYAYVFDVQQKQVFISGFGEPYYLLEEFNKFNAAYKRWEKKYDVDPDNAPDEPEFEQFLAKINRTERFAYPNMKNVQKVKLGGPGSGLSVISK